MKTFGTMLDAVFSPGATAKKLKGKTSMGDGAKAVLLGSLIPAIILALLFTLMLTLMSGMFSAMPVFGQIVNDASGWITGFGLIAFILILILIPLLAMVSWIINTAILFIFAKIWGGKGSFANFAAPWGYALGGLMLFTWIPMIGIIFAIYALYLMWVYLKVLMNLSGGRAAAVILTEFLVIGLIVAVVTIVSGS